MLILILLASWSALFQPGDVERSDYLRLQGEALYDEEKYEESLVFYQQAFTEVEKTDPVRAANLCNDMSSVYYALDQVDVSVEKCREGIALLNGSTERPDSVYFKLYSSLGTMFHSKASVDSSSYYYLLSDKLLEENAGLQDEIPEYVLHHYLNQGRSVWRKHRYYDSKTYFEKALALSKKKGMTSELYYIYSSLAEVYDLLKQYDKSLEWRRQAVAEVPVERTQSRLSLYAGIGNTYRLLSNTDSSLVWFNRSLGMLPSSSIRSENHQVQYLYLMTGLGNLHLQTGRLGVAREMFNKAEHLYHQYSLAREVLYSNISLSKGNLEKQAGNPDKAMEYYQRAYRALLSDPSSGAPDDPEKVKYPRFAVRSLEAMADIYLTRYRKSGALQDLEESHELYNWLITLKKESYRQVVSNIDDRYFYSADTQPVMEAAIRNGFEYYEKTGSEKALEVLFNRFEDANTAYLMDLILRDSDQSGHSALSGQLELGKIKEAMDDQSAFISYKLIDDHILAFVLTRRDAKVRKWKIDRSKFDAQLQALLLEVKVNPGLGRYSGSQLAQGCYEALLEPLEKWIGGYKRWIIVRDWKFSSLPFEVLEKNANQFIGDRHRIAYAYSASFFWFHPLLEMKPKKVRDAFVVAPFVRQGKQPYTIEGWKPVSTLEEVLGMGQTYVLGEHATKHSFVGQGDHHYVVNLATHAFADLQNPNSSYVQFYPGIDSKLYLDEIMNLKLDRTRLIMLSSCFGNEGVELAGEGTVSLAYAFAQAGCPSLVTTIWEANENTTGFLTLHISKYIEKGLPLDEALQLARQKLRASGKFGKYDHPYFWANISLLGNYSPLYQRQNAFVEYWYIILSAVLTGFIFFVWKRGKSIA